MYSENSTFPDGPKAFEKPKKRPWYRRWWGVLIIGLLTIILVITVAMVFYVFNLAKKIAAGEITPDKLFNNSNVSTASQPDALLYGDRHLTMGNAQAPIQMVIFIDFECPACQQMEKIIKQAVNSERYKDKVYLIYRQFPLYDSHPNALGAAMSAECANEQGKFSEMHDLMFERQDKLTAKDLKLYAIQLGLDGFKFSACLESQKYLRNIENDLQDGLRLNITETPTIYINDRKTPGVITQADLEQIFDILIK